MASSDTGGSIFARIARKEVDVPALYEDDFVIAFADIAPQAPVHVIIIPKRPIANVADLADSDAEVAGRLLLAAAEVARRTSIDQSGYRVVLNTGSDGGQTVPYLHAHVLGGRPMAWPPG